MVGDAATVGRGEADVEVLVMGVAAQVLPVGAAGVEVPVRLVVGEEVDARADPHRVREVAAQRHQRRPRAVAPDVDPDRAGGAAAVALPAGRVARVTTDDDTLAARFERDRPGGPDAQRRRGAAGDGHRVEVGVAPEGLRGVGGDDDGLPVLGPADGGGERPEPREAAGGAAIGIHHVGLGGAVVAADEGDRAPVGREDGERRRARIRRQAAGSASGDGYGEEVVLAHEDEAVAVDRGMSEVAGRFAHGSSVPRHAARGSGAPFNRCPPESPTDAGPPRTATRGACRSGPTGPTDPLRSATSHRARESGARGAPHQRTRLAARSPAHRARAGRRADRRAAHVPATSWRVHDDVGTSRRDEDGRRPPEDRRMETRRARTGSRDRITTRGARPDRREPGRPHARRSSRKADSTTPTSP